MHTTKAGVLASLVGLAATLAASGPWWPPSLTTDTITSIAQQHGGHAPPAKPPTPPQQGGHEGHGMEPAQHSMPMGDMKGTQGNWPMSRQGSGTSWLPESSPMFMKMLPRQGGFEIGLMGSFSGNYADAGGPRGDSQFFSNSMGMLMLRRGYDDGSVLGFQLMASLDPIFNGKKGYPDLFQTGETANGQPLQDRQHPHDLISEVAVMYSKPIGASAMAIGYLALVGEPALGGSMFMMRPSGMENPEAPIGHHWFDSTHISFGVATLGLVFDKAWKFEGSAFNGTEPDENRYNIDPIKFDSYSGRISYNPSADWSFQASYGFLDEPEAVLEPGISQHRLTASAMHSRTMANGDNLSLALLFGRNIKAGEDATNALAIEGTYYRGVDDFFARLERVEKYELVGVPAGTYTINKLTFGGVRNVASKDGFDLGIGGVVGLHSFPSSLDQFYGNSPVSFGVFLRIRPSRMKHGHGAMVR